MTKESDGAERDGAGRGRWVDCDRVMSRLPTRACTLCSLYSLFWLRLYVCVCVDQDRAGAVVREVGQKQIQLDQDKTLQTKSPAELKTGRQQNQSKNHVCAVRLYALYLSSNV